MLTVTLISGENHMSSSTTPRRALPEPQRKRWPLLLGTSLATLAVAGGIGLAATTGDDHKVATTAGTAASSSAQTAAATACTDASLAVDPAWADAVQAAAAAYGASHGDACTPQVHSRPSSEVATQGLGSDTAWVPEDASLVATAKDQALAGSKATTLGSSPFVLALPAEAAKALGKPLTGDVLRGLVTTQATWKDYGQPSWGRFKLVTPPIGGTVTGAAGFGALLQQVGGGATPQGNYLSSDPAEVAMARVQQRVVATVPTEKVVTELAAHPEDLNGYTTPGPRAGLTTEAQALRQPSGISATPVAPGAGITMAVAAPSSNEHLDAFTGWLATEDGQKALAAHGVTAGSHRPDAAALKALGLPATAATVKANDPKYLAQVRGVEAAYARRASLMLVLDTSGSMGNPAPGGGGRLVDMLIGEMFRTWDVWPAGMSNGLMTFNAKKADNSVDIKTVVPLQPDDTVEWQKVQKQLAGQLTQLPTEGGTPLYEAITTGYKYNLDHYQVGKDNYLIVLTDGSNQDSTSTVTLANVLKAMPSKPDPTKPIKVLYVGLGPGADMTALEQIAKATNATAVKINTPAELNAGIMRYIVGA